MKITDVRTTLLTGPCTEDPSITACRIVRSAAFIEIETDHGLTGIGETYAGYFCPELIPAAVEFFRPILIGRGVDDIPTLWARMYHCGNFWCRVGLGIGILNGIEAALWDLKGKQLGKPVYELLGGAQHRSLLAYATGGPSNYPESELRQKVDFYLEEGFRGVKLGAGRFDADGWSAPGGLEGAAEFEAGKLELVRKYVGPDVEIMLDGHMGNSPTAAWDLPTAIEVAEAIGPSRPLFLEEPLPYSDPLAYAELCRRAEVPIAGGECLTAASEWKTFTDVDAFDIGQPDASFTGGLGEFMRIAAVLQERKRKIATHSWGAAGSLMQNVHCGFASANTLILEVPPGFGPMHRELLDGSFVMRDGKVLPPDRPGLGICLTDDIKARFPFVPGSGEYNSVPGKVMPEDSKFMFASAMCSDDRG